MTETAAEGSPVGQPSAAGAPAFPPTGQQYPTAQQQYPPTGQQYPAGGPEQYPPGQPSYATGAQANQPGAPSYATGAQTFQQGPPSYATGGPQYPAGSGPPSQPPKKGRGPLVAIVAVVVVLLAYVGIAAAAKLPPFKKSAATTTSSTTFPPTSSTLPPVTTKPSTTTTSTQVTPTTNQSASTTLFNAIPNNTGQSWRGHCSGLTTTQINSDAPGAEAAYNCAPETGPSVLYAIFPTKAAAQSTYNTTIKDDNPSGLPTGACVRGNNVKGTYTAGSTGPSVGSIACFTLSGAQVVFWWHYSDNIDTFASSNSLSLAKMMSEWSSSLGPN